MSVLLAVNSRIHSPSLMSQPSSSSAAPLLSDEARLQGLLQQMRQPAVVPPSAAYIRQTLVELSSLLLPSADAAAPTVASDSSLPSPLLCTFCAGSGYGILTSWLWRRDVASEIATQLMVSQLMEASAETLRDDTRSCNVPAWLV